MSESPIHYNGLHGIACRKRSAKLAVIPKDFRCTADFASVTCPACRSSAVELAVLLADIEPCPHWWDRSDCNTCNPLPEP